MILIWNGIWYRSLKNYVTANELHCNFSSQVRVFWFFSRKKSASQHNECKTDFTLCASRASVINSVGSTRGLVLIFGAVAVDISLSWAHPSIMASVPHGASVLWCVYPNTERTNPPSYPCNEHPFLCNWKGNFPYPFCDCKENCVPDFACTCNKWLNRL